MASRFYPDLDWSAWRDDWPLAAHSLWVQTPRMRWHVQRLGQGPVVVLLHGTGATTHTWRDIAPNLARDHEVLCVDLPGHGFSSAFQGQDPAPEPVCDELDALFQALKLSPEVMVGHSAGAVVAANWLLRHPPALDRCTLVAINPAWQALPGPSQWLFPLGAWLIDKNPLSGWLLAQRARQPQVVERLLAQTGSALDSAAVSLYRRMLSQPVHVRGVLQLMCAWQVRTVQSRFADLLWPVQLHVGLRDATVPPNLAQDALRQLPRARYTPWPGLGHLLHEERPHEWVQALREGLALTGQGPPNSMEPPHPNGALSTTLA